MATKKEQLKILEDANFAQMIVEIATDRDVHIGQRLAAIREGNRVVLSTAPTRIEHDVRPRHLSVGEVKDALKELDSMISAHRALKPADLVEADYELL
jgi:hypothetical protein